MFYFILFFLPECGWREFGSLFEKCTFNDFCNTIFDTVSVLLNIASESILSNGEEGAISYSVSFKGFI